VLYRGTVKSNKSISFLTAIYSYSKMAPITLNTVDDDLKEVIQHLFEIQSAVHGYLGPETQTELVRKMYPITTSHLHYKPMIDTDAMDAIAKTSLSRSPLSQHTPNRSPRRKTKNRRKSKNRKKMTTNPSSATSNSPPR
jgi:mediator of RNA polymerase II transcription subunit 10